MVGGRNNGLWQGCVRFSVGECEGRTKIWRASSLKQVQRHDVRAQRRNVPQGGAANVATLGSNVMTFQRSYKSNVATLGFNVTTFHRRVKLTSRR